MQFIDTENVGVYLDGVNLRLEKNKDGETKVIDLTLRIQPFTAELAAALDPEIRALLFNLTDAAPKPKLKSAELKLPVPRQHLDVYLLPGDQSNAHFQITLLDADISDPRVRTEKGVDGYALIFYATIGPVGREELEYVVNWYTGQRFLTFREAQPTLALDEQTEQAPRHRAKAAEQGASAGA